MWGRAVCTVLERVTRDGFTEDMTFESLKEDAEEIYEDIWGKNKAKL